MGQNQIYIEASAVGYPNFCGKKCLNGCDSTDQIFISIMV